MLGKEEEEKQKVAYWQNIVFLFSFKRQEIAIGVGGGGNSASQAKDHLEAGNFS